MNRRSLSFILAAVTTAAIHLLAFGAHADVRLPAIFSDNMVLQREKAVPVWGWAQPGEKVKVECAGQSTSTVADANGKWQVSLKSLKTGGPYTLKITGNNSITLTNVMAGEVWLCSGQSNMSFQLNRANNSAQEIAAANFPEIRLFTVGAESADEPQNDCKGQWKTCTPESSANFSAVAYFFGRELNQKLRVPIGLINSSVGGTPSEAWTSRKVMESNPAFAQLLQNWKTSIATYDPVKTKERNDRVLAGWKRAVAKAKADGTAPPQKPLDTDTPAKSKRRPANLYNGMIAPLLPFGIRGAIWYQGEANATRSLAYREYLPALIRNWRDDFKQGDFSFHIVQLANFKQTQDQPGDSGWAELREAQLLTMKKVPHTGMAVIIDIGQANDIHPTNKQDVGKRLAAWALAKDYGQGGIFSGPIFHGIKKSGDQIVVEFEQVDAGLKTKNSEPLKGFAIAGEDKKWRWAEAKIEGKTIVVSHPDIKKPVAVRYAWADNPVCNLYNEAGFPASPFRTDDWTAVTKGGF